MKRRTLLMVVMTLLPTAALAAPWHFLRNGLGNAILQEDGTPILEESGLSTDWLLEENNNPGQ